MPWRSDNALRFVFPIFSDAHLITNELTLKDLYSTSHHVRSWKGDCKRLNTISQASGYRVRRGVIFGGTKSIDDAWIPRWTIRGRGA